MVRERKILSAAVDVDGLAEVLLGHRRALDVPSRSAHAPRRLPSDFGFLFAGLPQREVQRILLDLTYRDAGAALKIVDVLSRQFAVFRELASRIIDVAVRLISVALVYQGLNELYDLRDVLRDLRMHVGLHNAQRLRVVEVLLDVFLGDFRSADALLLGPVDDLVIHVGKVLHELDLVASVFEVPSECIEHHERSGVSYVKEIVDRRSADIHPDLARLDRYEFFFPVSKRVVNLHVSSYLFMGRDSAPRPVKGVCAPLISKLREPLLCIP